MSCECSNRSFGNNNDAETEPDCDQTLLGEVDLKSDLTYDGVSDWSLRENDGDVFSNKYWSNEKSLDDKYLSRRDDETFLNSSSRTGKPRKKGKKIFILIFIAEMGNF